MTKEKAVELLLEKRRELQSFIDITPKPEETYPHMVAFCEALDVAAATILAQQEAEKNEPQTNADRIRAMSDEELAAHLEDWQDWGGGLSKETWLEWLRQPMDKEADHEEGH